MHKAYATLTTKSFSEDDDYVYVEGIASTPRTDRMGDVVEPLGAKFQTPMPFLLYHLHNMPVGEMFFAQPTKEGIPFKSRIPKVKEDGVVKMRVDEAIHSLKYGLIKAVSIGFAAIEGAVERIKGGGLRFKEWEWLELSLVVVPANSDAVITAIKAFDQQHLPAFGQDGVEGDIPAPVGAETKRLGPVYLNPVKPARKHEIIEVLK